MIADADAKLFRDLAHMLDEFFSPIFGKFGN